MFLNRLSEKEKNAFLSLSIHVSNANGKFHDAEKDMIQEYCREMGIPFFDAGSPQAMDEIIAVFKEADAHIKKIVLLEILGLAYADGNYDQSEKTFVLDCAEKIGLTDSDIEKTTAVIREYLAVIQKIGEVIQ